MKEKLGISMIISTGFTALLFIFVTAFPQLLDNGVEADDFAKGLGAALLCCASALIGVFGYNKSSCSDKK